MVLYYKLAMDNDQTIFQTPSGQVPAQTSVNPLPEPSLPPNPQTLPNEPFVQAPGAEELSGAAKQSEPIVPSAQQLVTENRPKFPGGGASNLFKKLLKVGIGLVVVIVIFALLFTVVLPKFTNSPSGQVTLTYWGLWEDSKTMQSLIDGFQRQYPNIKVNYSQQDVRQYRQRLVTRINNGNGPDIFRFHNSWYPMLSSVLLPLSTDTISTSDFKKDFYPVAQKDLMINGAIYGIPLEIDTLGLYVNTQLFQSAGLTPPTNWNDFIDDARTLTVKDSSGQIKTAGAALGTYDNITHAPDIVSLLLLQNGVDISNLQSSSDRGINALNFYTSFATDQNNVWDNTLDPSILAFSKGNLAMFFGYSWDYFTIKQDNPKLSFKIVPVPQLPGQDVNMASYWAEGVSVKSKHQKEALLFMKYLAQKSTEENLYAEEAKERTFGEIYARTDLASTLVSNPVLSAFVQQAPSAFSSPFVDSTYDNGLNQELNTYLGNAINSILNGTSAETAFNTLLQGTVQVFKKYGQ